MQPRKLVEEIVCPDEINVFPIDPRETGGKEGDTPPMCIRFVGTTQQGGQPVELVMLASTDIALGFAIELLKVAAKFGSPTFGDILDEMAAERRRIPIQLPPPGEGAR